MSIIANMLHYLMNYFKFVPFVDFALSIFLKLNSQDYPICTKELPIKICYIYIVVILENADLTQMSAKKVRVQLEEKLSCDLTARKKEIDSLVMDFVNAKNEKDAKSDSESEEEVEVPEIKPKKAVPKRKLKEESEEEVELERSTRNTRTRAKPKKVRRKTKTEGDDGDETTKTKVNKTILI